MRRTTPFEPFEPFEPSEPSTLNPEPNESKVKRGCEEMRIHFFTAPSRYTYFFSTDKRMSIWIGFAT